MVDYKGLLQGRLNILKTEYITAKTNIKRVEKDLKEAKKASLEVLGAIKNLEFMVEHFSKAESAEPKLKEEEEEEEEPLTKTPKRELKSKNK